MLLCCVVFFSQRGQMIVLNHLFVLLRGLEPSDWMVVCVLMALNFGSCSVLLRVRGGAFALASSCVLFSARPNYSIALPFSPSRGLD